MPSVRRASARGQASPRRAPWAIRAAQRPHPGDSGRRATQGRGALRSARAGLPPQQRHIERAIKLATRNSVRRALQLEAVLHRSQAVVLALDTIEDVLNRRMPAVGPFQVVQVSLCQGFTENGDALQGRARRPLETVREQDHLARGVNVSRTGYGEAAAWRCAPQPYRRRTIAATAPGRRSWSMRPRRP